MILSYLIRLCQTWVRRFSWLGLTFAMFSKWSWTLTCLITAGWHAQSPATGDDREPVLPLPTNRQQNVSGLGLGNLPVIWEVHASCGRLLVHLERPESGQRRNKKQNGELLDCGDAEVSVPVVFRRSGSDFAWHICLQHWGPSFANVFLTVPCSVFLDEVVWLVGGLLSFWIYWAVLLSRLLSKVCSCVCVEMFEYVSKYSLIDSDSREAFREMIWSSWFYELVIWNKFSLNSEFCWWNI